MTLVPTDWAAVLAGSHVVAESCDATPEAPVLEALAAGTAASPAVASGESGPDDLATARSPSIDAVLLAGRDGHPFRKRERHQLIALARQAQDRGGKARAGRAEQPRGAHDRVAPGRRFRDSLFAGELGAAVRGHRPHRV